MKELEVGDLVSVGNRTAKIVGVNSLDSNPNSPKWNYIIEYLDTGEHEKILKKQIETSDTHKGEKS